MSFIDVLAQKKIISERDVTRIKQEARKTGGNLEDLLIQNGVDPKEILLAKGAFLNIPAKPVDIHAIPYDILKLIPEESAKYYQFAPIGRDSDVLEVGIVNPDNIEARDALNFISTKIGMPYKLFLISEEDFSKVLEAYKGLSGEVTKALDELDTELRAPTEDLDTWNKAEELTPVEVKGKEGTTRIIEDAPVTKIVATLLRYAIEGNASDIHIEHTGSNIRVRFRVDGELHTSLVLPVNVHRSVVSRVKILSNMRLDERRKPQDGRFSAKIEGREVDFRVSTFPSFYGEKVVMRILDKDKGVHSLEDLGISRDQIALLRTIIKKPYGLILISGPTGSGKSTTLYAMLNEVDRDTKNVLSLEDPVEFNIEGMSQSQVRPEIEYTFASGLRSILRQDPDVIMVGEIRDKETAQLAIQAALTGHLVFSTIHTNNAIGVIPRLIDMGVDPFLIAPTLVLAMAQRLVRRLCNDKGKPMPIEGSIKEWIEKSFEDLPGEVKKLAPLSGNLYEVLPTADCSSGMKGRMAVTEMFTMNREIEEAILKNPTEDAISQIVRSKGMLTMQEDALLKCAAQKIPFSEVNSLG